MRTFTTQKGYELTQVLGGRSNVFLLTNGNRNILIDTGRKQYREKLISNLRSIGARAIDYLVLTHSHFDHVESAEFFKRNYRSMVFVHSSEAAFLARGKNPPLKGTMFPTKIYFSLFGEKMLTSLTYRSCEADVLVNEIESFSGYGIDAYLLHTPGHSIGSMSLIIDNEIAVVGDAMFGVFPNSIFPPFAADIKEVVKSWGKLLDTKCQIFLPMHGLPRTRALVEKCYKKRQQK